MSLKQVSKIFIRFNPMMKGTSSVKEFVSRCTSPKALASNPDCVIKTQLTTRNDPPTVTVEFANGMRKQFETSKLTAEQLSNTIKDERELLDSQDLLKKNGITENDRLVSDWGRPDCIKPKIWASIEQ